MPYHLAMAPYLYVIISYLFAFCKLHSYQTYTKYILLSFPQHQFRETRWRLESFIALLRKLHLGNSRFLVVVATQPHPVFKAASEHSVLLSVFASCLTLSPLWTSSRPISNSQLHMLPCFHLCPIYLVVFKGSSSCDWRSYLEGGFTLRCLQRLSRPDLATLPCGWYHNRSTSGPSTPVLSY